VWDWSGLTLEASGDAARVGHLRREFGAADAGAPPSQADVEVRFGSTEGSFDRHKGTWWRMAVSSPEQVPIALSLNLHGLFADALVQSVVIEQALALAAPLRGFVLLPAAAMRSLDGRTFVVLGSAGAGKTTLALEALVAGWTVLGDDHVLVDRSGRCLGLPRRMRLYPSTIDLVPRAASRLLASERRALGARHVARRLTAGRVRLPALIPPDRFGRVSAAVWEMPDHVVSLDRSMQATSVDWAPMSTEAAAINALRDIATDRRRLARNLGEPWSERLGRVRDAEREILSDAWRQIPAGHAVVPGSWPPDRILEWLAAVPPAT
jgi:hypothetical protein